MKYIFLILCAIGMCSTYVFAQDEKSQISFDTPLELRILPENPSAYTPVTVQLEGNAFELKNILIDWFINDSLLLEKSTTKKISFTTKAPGTQTLITAKLYLNKKLYKTLTLTSGSDTVDLIWESKSTAPYWYLGKRLMPPEDGGRIIAIPHIFADKSKIDTDDLYFDWYFNGSKDIEASGLGNNLYDNDISPQKNTISVVIRDNQSSIRAKKSITIPRTRTEIHIYEHNPLLGLLTQKSLSGALTLPSGTIELEAVPFFFSNTRDTGDVPLYSWYVNKKQAQTLSPQIVIKTKQGDSGSIEVRAQMQNRLLQSARKIFNVLFQ